MLRQPIWKMDLGTSYTVLKGSGTTTARLSDVFNTMRFAFEGTKTKKLDSIEINFDCHYFPDSNDYSAMDQMFIQTAVDLKNIDILVVQPSGQLTQNYLRYRKTKNGYQYIGTVK